MILLIIILFIIFIYKRYENFGNIYEVKSISIGDKRDFTILVYENNEFTIYQSNQNGRIGNLWAQDMPIISFTINYMKSFNKKFIISGTDELVHIDNLLNEYGNSYIYFAPSIDKPYFDRFYESNMIYPIPQKNNEFENAFLGKSFENISDKPFNERYKKIMFRGSMNGSTRVPLIDNIRKCESLKDYIDIKYTDRNEGSSENRLSEKEQCEYKYILSIDGNGWPGSINWVLRSGSVPLICSTHYVWYFPLLRPFIDYIPIDKDNPCKNIENILSDEVLSEKIALESPKRINKILSYQKYYIDQCFNGVRYCDIIEDIRKKIE